jgi:LysR family glycine cleavage system transcriptional activator
LVDLAGGEADIGIRGHEERASGWAGLVCHRLFNWQFTPMCSPDFLAKWGPIASPHDLLGLPLLSLEDPWWARWFALVGIEASDLPVRSGFRTELQHLQGRAAVAGQGVALLSPIFWSAELASGALVRLFPDVGHTQGGMWLTYHPDRATSRKVRIFRDWLLPQFEPAALDDYPQPTVGVLAS